MSTALSVSPDLLRAAPQAPGAAASTGYGASEAAKRARIARTAQDFETSFTSIMLGEMFEGVQTSAPFGGGEAEGMMKSFMTDAIARQMSRRGGVGLSAMIQKEMLKMQGLDAAPSPTGPAPAAAAPAKAAA